MADSRAQTPAKLQLDEETGEMVSKNELKKRTQKRAKKAASAARAIAVPEANVTNVWGVQSNSSSPSQLKPKTMFEHGWLAEVYKDRPVKEAVTRFPPEPNGHLHLGHAKAIAVNFGFARAHNGRTILRFDDTNPTAEREEYFVAIKDMIQWLGFQSAAITYTSDNFDNLYELAEKLIGLGKGYVCHCNQAELTKQRGGKDGKAGPRYRCAHAEQDVETNLGKFRNMRAGKYRAKEAVLRMKQDINNPNPQMWDIAAYRIPDKTHHYRTGDKWKIYPTYDFAHCLCDSIEGITHSLCTTEFLRSRESYDWLIRALGVYGPLQRESGRLNVDGAVMSKTAINDLIQKGTVQDETDPRLYTLAGLRRRGVPSGALLSFMDELGVTTTESSIQPARFEQSIRHFLDPRTPRLMMVLDPVPVVIDGLQSIHRNEVEVPFWPKDTDMGSHKVSITDTIFIDRSDFQELDDPNFFRLAPGRTAGLLSFPAPIIATGFDKDVSGNVTQITAVLVADEDAPKPRSHIHWVPDGSEIVEVRTYDHLLNIEASKSVDETMKRAIKPESKIIHESAMIEAGFDEILRMQTGAVGTNTEALTSPETVRFQALRIGYFAMDRDTTKHRKVFNQIVPLKESSVKF